MPQTDILITCANCGRPVREADAEGLGWRFYSDGVGELEPFCGLCAHREHPDTPASTDRPFSGSLVAAATFCGYGGHAMRKADSPHDTEGRHA